MLTVSTGIGGGIVLDGELLDGASANAGHVGHIIVEPNGRRCGCGARGCLEAEASGLAIEAITGRSPKQPTYEIMQRTGRIVGRGAASLCNLLDLELVVVGGGVALGFAATFFNAAQEELSTRCRLPYSRHARITPTRLGDRGPLIGAGAVGVRGLRRDARSQCRRSVRTYIDAVTKIRSRARAGSATVAGREAAGSASPAWAAAVAARLPHEGRRRADRPARAGRRDLPAAAARRRQPACLCTERRRRDGSERPVLRSARRRSSRSSAARPTTSRCTGSASYPQAFGGQYEETFTEFFSGAVNTGCGQATAQVGPFYCPADGLVYFDLEFLSNCSSSSAPPATSPRSTSSPTSTATTSRTSSASATRSTSASAQDPGRANQYSIALELQADCFAGAWAHDAEQRGQLEPGEIDEALNAAAAVGDDRIQQQTQGRVNPESWTHGSSEQRVSWFRRGFETGDPNSCDTFAEL